MNSNAAQNLSQPIADRRMAAPRPLYVDREISMPTVPQDIFRRKQAYRYLANAERAIRLYADIAIIDNAVAAEAGFLDLAASLMRHVRRDDLAQEFEGRKMEAIVRAQTAQPVRRRRRKGSKKPQPSQRVQPRAEDHPEE